MSGNLLQWYINYSDECSKRPKKTQSTFHVKAFLSTYFLKFFYVIWSHSQHFQDLHGKVFSFKGQNWFAIHHILFYDTECLQCSDFRNLSHVKVQVLHSSKKAEKNQFNLYKVFDYSSVQFRRDASTEILHK